jgi:hypothetical protein
VLAGIRQAGDLAAVVGDDLVARGLVVQIRHSLVDCVVLAGTGGQAGLGEEVDSSSVGVCGSQQAPDTVMDEAEALVEDPGLAPL